MKATTIVMLCVVCTIITAIVLIGRDIPVPDTSDLSVDRPVVAAEQNAYTYFLSATNVFHAPTNRLFATDYLEGKPADEGAVEQLIATNGEAMALIEQGLACPVCVVPEVTSLDTPLDFLSPWKNMGRIMALKTRHDRLAGRYVQATDTCIALLKFGNMVEADAGCILNYLVGIAILGLGQEQAQDLARDRGFPPEQLKRLSNCLTGPEPYVPGLIRAIKAEYWIDANTLDQFRDGKLGMNEIIGDAPIRLVKRRWIPGYLFQANATKLMFADCYGQMIKDAPLRYADMKHPCLGASELNRPASLITRPNAVGKILYGMLVPAFDSLLEKKCRAETSLAATRLIVACNACRKQQGKLPEDLQALVPTYLAVVPADPYDGKAFRYVPAKGIIYSVGKDLKDSGGSTRVPGGERMYSQAELRWLAEDVVFQVEEPTLAPPTAAVPLP